MSKAEPVARGGTRPIGFVVSVSGSQAVVALTESIVGAQGGDTRCTVGSMLELHTGGSMVVGIISSVTRPMPTPELSDLDTRLVEVELMGELRVDPLRGERFFRGVSDYPTIDDPAYAVRAQDVERIFNANSSTCLTIGKVSQAPDNPAPVDLQKLLTHHFAFLGASGVGKSCGIVMLLQAIIDKFEDFRIFIIDPHNEYKSCFGDRSVVLTPSTMNLPFWLFNFEEIVDVFFLGRPGVQDEVDLLREIIPIAKNLYFTNVNRAKANPLRRMNDRQQTFGVDAPVPYRISDLVAIIDQRAGKLESRGDLATLRRLKQRIETVSQDPRCGFMFGHLTIEDTMVDVLGYLFRIPDEGKPISVVEVAGLPAEIVDAVVSVLCRLAFDFGIWSDGAFPILLVCEEAHRYIPAANALGFGPTRRALSRIAKEGRKYGLYLGLSTQRPAELDPTILSQCGTVFAMRLSNERDQAIVRAAVPDAATSQLGFLPALGAREALAIGEAVTMPMRLKFNVLDPASRPRSHARPIDAVATSKTPNVIADVVRRWRAAATQTTDLAEPLPAGMGTGEAAEPTRAPSSGSAQEACPPARPPVPGEAAAELAVNLRRTVDGARGEAAGPDWSALRDQLRR